MSPCRFSSPPCEEEGGKEQALLPEQSAREITRLDFVGGQCLLVERGKNEDLLRLVAASGDVAFSVRITPDGPVLRFESDLRIEASGALEFAGTSVVLSGKEGVRINSGGDASIEVAGDLTSTARVQNLNARLGNVNVKANDDVRLTGERVRLNC